MAMETQDIVKRSATNPITPAPRARDYTAEVAKLIDVSSCVGCKACQVACSEWNDIRDEVGHCVGVYDNPADLSAKSWTVMRFSETDQNGKLEQGTRESRPYGHHIGTEANFMPPMAAIERRSRSLCDPGWLTPPPPPPAAQSPWSLTRLR
jgi:ferredoxin